MRINEDVSSGLLQSSDQGSDVPPSSDWYYLAAGVWYKDPKLELRSKKVFNSI